MDFKRLIKNIHLSTSLITLISIVLLTLSFVFSFDAKNGYFVDGILPIMFQIFFVLGIILSLACAFAIKKDKIIKTENTYIKQKQIFLFFAATIIIFSVVFNLFVLDEYFTEEIIGLCFFGLFVFLCAIKGGYEYSHLKLLFLLLSSIFPTFAMLDTANDMERHTNSVENMLTSIFAIAFLMYILYEGNRIFSGEHSRWHLSSLLLISHTGLVTSASYMIAYLLGKVDEQTRFYQMVLILVVSLFAALELQRFVKDAEARTKEEWRELEAPEEIIEEITEE